MRNEKLVLIVARAGTYVGYTSPWPEGLGPDGRVCLLNAREIACHLLAGTAGDTAVNGLTNPKAIGPVVPGLTVLLQVLAGFPVHQAAVESFEVPI